MASTQNSYVSSYASVKTTKYPVDDPRLVVPTLAVSTPRFSLLPLTSTTYLRPPKSIPNRSKKCFNNGNQNYYKPGNVTTKTGCAVQKLFHASNSFGQTFHCCEDGIDLDKLENFTENTVLKQGGEPKDNSIDLINKGLSAIIKKENDEKLFVPSEAKSSMNGEQTATINSLNSINKNINSDQTDSPIIKSKWNVPSPSALIPAINGGSKCLMGHEEVLTASSHTTLVHNQSPLTSDCYPPVTAEMEAPSVSHSSPLLYDSVNAAACQYINYNKHMLEIKQLVEERVRPSDKQLIGTQNQHRYHHANGQENEVKETDSLVIATDLSSTDDKNIQENHLNGKSNSFNDNLTKEDLLYSKNEFKQQYLFTNMPIKLERNNAIDYPTDVKEQGFNGLNSIIGELNKNKIFSFDNYFLERGSNDTNVQIRLEEGFLNKEGGTVVKEDVMSLTRDVAANGITDVTVGIDGQAVKRVSLAAPYHRHNHHKQSGHNSSNDITTTTTTAVQYIDKTTTINSCNTSQSQLAELTSSNQGYQHLSGISTQVIKSDNKSETDRVTAGVVPQINATKEDNTENFQFTEEDNIISAISEAGGELLIFKQGKASGENHLLIDSNEEVHEEDTMEGDIDVETSSNSSRSSSPVVDLRKQAKLDSNSIFNNKCSVNQDDPQDLSMKTKKKSPMIIAPLPSNMEKLSELSSSKYITIEPTISPYHDRYDHKDYRCSPPGLHVIVPNTINQASMTTTTSTTNNRLNSESINTKLGGGQCIGDKNGQVNHNNVAVINYGKRHNDCNGKMSNNGQRENAHNLAAVDGVNGGNKYSNNKTSGSFTVHTMVCGSNGSSPDSIYSTGLATANDKTQLFNTTAEQGHNGAATCSGSGETEDSDLHIIVDQDFSDSEEPRGEDDGGSSKTLRMTPGDDADMNGKQEGGLTEDMRHFTAGEDGPITPDENEHDAQHRDSASAKDSDEVMHSCYLFSTTS